MIVNTALGGLSLPVTCRCSSARWHVRWSAISLIRLTSCHPLSGHSELLGAIYRCHFHRIAFGSVLLRSSILPPVPLAAVLCIRVFFYRRYLV